MDRSFCSIRFGTCFSGQFAFGLVVLLVVATSVGGVVATTTATTTNIVQ
jgi:hypothetical protein